MARLLTAVLMATMLFTTSCEEGGKQPPTNGRHIPETKTAPIDGIWEAHFIAGTTKPFEEIYPEFLPTITFETEKNHVSGMNGCNNFTGTFTMDGNKITWSDQMAATRKMCPDMTGEQLFMDALKRVNSFSVSDDGRTLNLISGDEGIMRFTRKI